MSTLKLTVVAQYYDMIDDLIKDEEYRKIKHYWIVRLMENVKLPDGSVFFMEGLETFKKFDFVEFKNGYRKDSRKMTFQCLGISIGKGKPEWGAIENEKYFVIKLGNKIS